jgi:hypothetical protein
MTLHNKTADSSETVSSVMSRLRRVRGVSWQWADQRHPSYRPGRQLGVIAEEVEAVFPDLVSVAPDGYRQVDYHGLVAPIIEALKELDARLQALEVSGQNRNERGGLPEREAQLVCEKHRAGLDSHEQTTPGTKQNFR